MHLAVAVRNVHVDRFATGQISVITGLSMMVENPEVEAWHARWETIQEITRGPRAKGITMIVQSLRPKFRC